jgi:hypothetical protein
VSVSRFVRWIPLAAVVALLGAAVLSAAFANPTIASVPDTPEPHPVATRVLPTFDPTDGPQAGVVESNGGQTPAWVGVVSIVLIVAVILGVVGVLVWMLLRDRLTGLDRSGALESDPPTPTPTPTETARRVRAALDEGLSDLDEHDADPRRVVIACWVRLEEAAAAAGIKRGVGDTSTDLVARLLAGAQVSAPVLDAFAAVYRQARFATHIVDISMRDQARSALAQLRDELEVSVS